MEKKMLLALLSGLILSTTVTYVHAEENSPGVGAAEAGKKQEQTICPVMGGKINKKLFYDYKGQRIYVCCQGCLDAIKKNPEKYLKKLAESGVVPEKVKQEEHRHH